MSETIDYLIQDDKPRSLQPSTACYSLRLPAYTLQALLDGAVHGEDLQLTLPDNLGEQTSSLQRIEAKLSIGSREYPLSCSNEQDSFAYVVHHEDTIEDEEDEDAKMISRPAGTWSLKGCITQRLVGATDAAAAAEALKGRTSSNTHTPTSGGRIVSHGISTLGGSDPRGPKSISINPSSGAKGIKRPAKPVITKGTTPPIGNMQGSGDHRRDLEAGARGDQGENDHDDDDNVRGDDGVDDDDDDVPIGQKRKALTTLTVSKIPSLAKVLATSKQKGKRVKARGIIDKELLEGETGVTTGMGLRTDEDGIDSDDEVLSVKRIRHIHAKDVHSRDQSNMSHPAHSTGAHGAVGGSGRGEGDESHSFYDIYSLVHALPSTPEFAVMRDSLETNISSNQSHPNDLTESSAKASGSGSMYVARSLMITRKKDFLRYCRKHRQLKGIYQAIVEWLASNAETFRKLRTEMEACVSDPVVRSQVESKIESAFEERRELVTMARFKLKILYIDMHYLQRGLSAYMTALGTGVADIYSPAITSSQHIEEASVNANTLQTNVLQEADQRGGHWQVDGGSSTPSSVTSISLSNPSNPRPYGSSSHATSASSFSNGSSSSSPSLSSSSSSSSFTSYSLPFSSPGITQPLTSFDSDTSDSDLG